MSLLRRLFGSSDSNRIRKDAGDLRLEDFERFPAWEFCLDEEGVDGQTECTMRPLITSGPLRYPAFDGMVAADMIAANGQQFVGLLKPTDDADNPWGCSPEIILPQLVGERISSPLIEGWNQFMTSDSPRISFHVPAIPEARARELISLAYQAMRIRAEAMWPLQVKPRVPIKGFPPAWQLNGWLNGGSPSDLKCILR